MTYIYEEDGCDITVTIKQQEKSGWNEKCTMCGKWFFMENHVLEGISMEKVPEENIRRNHIILR